MRNWRKVLAEVCSNLDIVTPYSDAPLLHMADKPATALCLAFVAGAKVATSGSSGDAPFFRCLAYWIDRFRKNRNQPPILTQEDGRWLETIRTQLLRPTTTAAGTANGGSSTASGAAGPAAAGTGTSVAAASTATSVRTFTPDCLPTREALTKQLGRKTGVFKGLLSFIYDFSDFTKQVGNGPQANATNKDRTSKERFDDECFAAVFRRLVLLSDVGRLDLLRRFWQHAVAQKFRTNHSLGALARLKEPATSALTWDDYAVATPGLDVIFNYVESYARFWNCPRTLGSFVPESVPETFWLGTEDFCYFPSLADICSSNAEHEQFKNIRDGAILAGWVPTGYRPLWAFLTSGGRSRQEEVERLASLPEALKKLAPENRQPRLEFWRKLNEEGNKRAGVTVTGDILAPVSSFLLARGLRGQPL